MTVRYIPLEVETGQCHLLKAPLAERKANGAAQGLPIINYRCLRPTVPCTGILLRIGLPSPGVRGKP
jgi:hypothetical protein